MDNRGRPSDSDRTEFGERLYQARVKRALTQEQIAELLEMDQSSYANWERNEVALKPAQIDKLVEILGVTPNYLFGKD